MSVFLLISYISYIIIKKAYDSINEKAKTENQIKLNGILRVVVQGLLLAIIIFAQLRYIERKDTVVLSHCEYYDRYGNLIIESQYYFDCPENSVIENTATSLKMEFIQNTDEYYFKTYFYNPEIELGVNLDNILGFMDFELLTTIHIIYNDLGYIENSETIHSLIVNNHVTEKSVLTTKLIALENTYINGIYTSLKTTTTAYDLDYEYQDEPQHLSLDGMPRYYEYTYTTLTEEDGYDQLDVYIVDSDEFGNALDGEIPELLLSSKVSEQEESLNISIESIDYPDIEITIEKNYASCSYGFVDMDIVFDWEDIGNVSLLKKDRTYENIGSIDYNVKEYHAITEAQKNGNQISFFRDYSYVFNQYPSLIKVTDYGYIREDYYAYNNNYFILEDTKTEEAWESIFLKNFNLHSIDEIYEPDSFFDLNNSSTLYQRLPYYYNYNID
jgi:hypothetical protein